jgi:hypothetical protein
MRVGIVDRGGYDDGEEQGEWKGHNDKKGKMRDTGMTSQGGTRGKSADRDEDDPNGVNEDGGTMTEKKAQGTSTTSLGL